MKGNARSHYQRNFFLFSLLLCISGKIFAQGGIDASISVDTSQKNIPLVLTLQSSRTDVAVIRITIVSPSGKFSAYLPQNDTIKILPISNQTLEIYAGRPDTVPTFRTGQRPIARFLTDSTIRQPQFLLEFLNKNMQAVWEKQITIVIPQQLALPAPCSQSFLSLSTGVNQVTGVYYPPGIVDPFWALTSVPTGSQVASVPGSAFVTQWIAGAASGIWSNGLEHGITCLPSSGSPLSPAPNAWSEPKPGYYRYARTFCSNTELPGIINMAVKAYDSCGVFFNNQLVGSSSDSYVGTIDAPFSISKSVNIIAGINILEVRLWRKKYDPNTFRITGGISANNIGSLGLTSDNCCQETGSGLGTISGHKYWDLNCNGMRESGEPGLANWTVTLTGPSISPQTVVTDASGWFSFTNLPTGIILTVTESTNAGWVDGATTTYTLALGPGQSAIRDFLNCKIPSCAHILQQDGFNEECCEHRFNLSNAFGPLKKIEYSVMGGALKFLNAESCSPSAITPVSLFASTSGSIDYAPSCSGPMGIELGAYSTTASGIVCVNLKFTFAYGLGEFTCDTTICFECERMPKECAKMADVIWATPHSQPDPMTDWHLFSVNNSKLPLSLLSGVDITFLPVPSSGHIGKPFITVAFDPNGTWGLGMYSWTSINSGGPSDPYSQIRLNCTGNANPHGPAASSGVWFVLGVEKLLHYSGVVHMKLRYCDGDSCEFDYKWESPLNMGTGTLAEKPIPKAPFLLNLEITVVDSTASFGLSLGDSSANIIAITAPSGDLTTESRNLTGMHVTTSGNSAIYRPMLREAFESNATVSVMIVYTTAANSDSIPVTIHYYNANGTEIGGITKTVDASKIISGVNPARSFLPGELAINSVVPNPASHSLTIKYSLGKSEDVRLEVFNSLGESIGVIAEGFASSGLHDVTYNVSSLAEGTYHIRLSNRFETITKGINIIH
jgi:hypothetical protein